MKEPHSFNSDDPSNQSDSKEETKEIYQKHLQKYSKNTRQLAKTKYATHRTRAKKKDTISTKYDHKEHETSSSDSDSPSRSPSRSPSLKQKYRQVPKTIDDTLSDCNAGLGKISFTLTYYHTTHTLSLHIKKAKRLPAKDSNGKSDPYVKVSNVSINTCTPVFQYSS